jgi:hypothetical protein
LRQRRKPTETRDYERRLPKLCVMRDAHLPHPIGRDQRPTTTESMPLSRAIGQRSFHRAEDIQTLRSYIDDGLSSGVPVQVRPEEFRAFKGAKPIWKPMKLSFEDKEENGYEWRVTTTLTARAEGYYYRGEWEYHGRYQGNSGREYETDYSTVLEKKKGRPWRARDEEFTINAPRFLKPMPCALVVRLGSTQEAPARNAQ